MFLRHESGERCVRDLSLHQTIGKHGLCLMSKGLFNPSEDNGSLRSWLDKPGEELQWGWMPGLKAGDKILRGVD